jgi:hypothetical protein
MMYARRCILCNDHHLVRVVVQQGIACTERALGRSKQPVNLRPILVVDDTSDWSLRTVHVCDICWCNYLRNENRNMPLSMLLRAFHSACATPDTTFTRRDYWLPRAMHFTPLLDPARWPSKEFVDRLKHNMEREDHRKGTQISFQGTALRANHRDGVTVMH